MKKQLEYSIDGELHTAEMSNNDGFWQYKIIKGSTPQSAGYGGNYKSFDEFEKHIIKETTYSYRFMKHGYKVAKEAL
jgi:hypothetical protein